MTDDVIGWTLRLKIHGLKEKHCSFQKRSKENRAKHLHSAGLEVCGLALWENLAHGAFFFFFYLTLVIQLSSVLGEAFQAHPLAEQIQELLQRRPRALVVVHLFLCALARLAVKHPHLVLEAQLKR